MSSRNDGQAATGEGAATNERLPPDQDAWEVEESVADITSNGGACPPSPPSLSGDGKLNSWLTEPRGIKNISKEMNRKACMHALGLKETHAD